MTVLAGIDLSLTASAIVACPSSWDGTWNRVRTATVGIPLPKSATVLERVQRTAKIAGALVNFCLDHRVELAWIESPAFNMRTSQHSLGELHGVVKLSLVDAGIRVDVAPVQSARKLLLGRVPRVDPKGAVQAALKAGGAPHSWSEDEYDAMAVLNWGLSEAGGWCLAQSEAA